MKARNTLEHYGWISKALHWLMGLAIIGMLAVGLYMTGLENTPWKLQLYGWHKATGALLLGLALLRILWRVTGTSPILPVAMPAIMKLGAHGGHLALYLLMLAMPLSGWAMSSAAGFPVSVFGWFTLPDLVAADKAAHEWYETVHELAAYLLIAVLVAHVSAALYHHFWHRDNVLRRMLPW